MDPPSNINTIVKAQIVFLMSTLTEDNFERNQSEIHSLTEGRGPDTYVHFIRRLIIQTLGRLSSPNPPNGAELNADLPLRLLVQETRRLSRDPNLADKFKDAVDKSEGDIQRQFDLIRFVDRVGPRRPLEKLILASTFVGANIQRKELAAQATSIIRAEVENATIQLSQRPCFDGQEELDPEQVFQVLKNLLTEPPLEVPVLDALQRQQLILSALHPYPRGQFSSQLQQILGDISLPSGTSLPQFLAQLGPEITSDGTAMRGILARFGWTDASPPRQGQVVDLFGHLDQLAYEGSAICDIGSLVRSVHELNREINWAALVESLATVGRHGDDTSTLKIVMLIIINCPASPDQHAVHGVWSLGRKPIFQLRLLEALLSIPQDTFNFSSIFHDNLIVTPDDVANASLAVRSIASNLQNQSWNAMPVLTLLTELSETSSVDVRRLVTDILDKGVASNADLIILGLLQAPIQKWSEIRVAYCRRLLAKFIGGHTNYQLVLTILWSMDPNYLSNALREHYEENPLSIPKIFDILTEIKVLEEICRGPVSTFILDLVVMASRRELLDLESWLNECASSQGAEFVISVVEFLAYKMESEKISRISTPIVHLRTVSINPPVIIALLSVIRNNVALLREADVEFCLETRNACLQIHPRLMVLTSGTTVEPGTTVVSYSADVESEVDAIYKQMYDEKLSIDEVVGLLDRTKGSTDSHEQEIFSCMIHFLFDEYKFFQSHYPTREIAMTGALYGSIINRRFLDNIPLGVAIRYVIDAIGCQPDTNLFKFGVMALSRFTGRLAEWEPVCEALLKIPHLAETEPVLASTIHRAYAKARNDPGVEEKQAEVPTFYSITPDTIPDELEQPPEEVADRILFNVNNLAPLNFDSKLADIKEQYKDQYAHWFANYLIDQRVSAEPNNHGLYLRMLDAFDKPSLHKLIVHETIIKAAVLLNAATTLQNSSERATLKNISSWLGIITLARDIPIRHKNISFKELLVEGFDTNRLIVAIPFVCKTLEGASKSRVFLPPNPWLMAVVGILAELYHFADLKLNLKFEIEMLCKTLNLDLDTVEISSVLRNRPANDPMGGLQLSDYPENMEALQLSGYPGQSSGVEEDIQALTLGHSGDVDSQRPVGPHLEAILTWLMQRVVISPQLGGLATNPHFKRAVQISVDRAIREIIVPVVERSVTIAGVSTKELVWKDYATEGSEEKLRKAGSLTAQKLAGSLALVTCKEPVKSNLASSLRLLLLEHNFPEVVSDNSIMSILIQDNLEPAYQAIEKAAMERAATDVDTNFALNYEARRRYREERSNQSFFDPYAVASTLSIVLPDPLQIRPSGVTAQQAAVYEEFGSDMRRRVMGGSRPGSSAMYTRNEAQAIGLYSSSPVQDSQLAQSQSYLMHSEAVERFQAILQDLEAVLANMRNVPSVGALPQGHELRLLLRSILVLANEATERNRTPLYISQKIVQLLYKAQTSLGREVYVALLDQLCRTFDDVAKEATTWLLYAEDERKLNVPVTVRLLRSGLVNITLQDQQLAKSLFQDARPSLLKFAASLVREYLASEPTANAQSQFTYTLEVLSQLAHAGKANEEVTRLLDDLGALRPVVNPESLLIRQAPTKPETQELREELFAWVQQWVNIFQKSQSPEKSFVPFITKLTKQGILKVEDVSSLFFRVCAEASINHYIACMTTNDYEHAYQAIDAMSRLIVYIIKYHGDASGVNNEQAKVHYLTKILSIFILVLANLHEEQGPAFQQKPFFRFFSSLVNDLHTIDAALGSAYFHLLIAISDTFSSLQPTYFPGFAFSWLGLISHRMFMPKLLSPDSKEGWPAYHKLLLSLFRFLAPFLRESDLHHAARDLYRGTLRLLLVLLHDFPEFLNEYYFTLCDAIPPRCIQLRNIILCAFPSTITLPDPYLRLRDVDFDSLPEMGPIPPILSDFTAALKSHSDIRAYLDQFLMNRGSSSFLPLLCDRLRQPGNEGSPDVYNLPLINSLVMYVGVSSVSQAKARSGSSLFSPSDNGAIVLHHLAANLDTEGQHHLLSAIVLQLRYPNAYTHWFTALILNLFIEVKEERFREIVTKVLLERFIVHRPHPWGALVTFIELLSNPKYDFWNRDFIRVAPEVTMLLENVARSIFTA